MGITARMEHKDLIAPTKSWITQRTIAIAQQVSSAPTLLLCKPSVALNATVLASLAKTAVAIVRLVQVLLIFMTFFASQTALQCNQICTMTTQLKHVSHVLRTAQLAQVSQGALIV